MSEDISPEDTSNGYDAIAEQFMHHRLRSSVGLATIRTWAASLPRGGAVLDVGAGSGEPLTAALIEAGFDVAAVDASPAMVAAFRRRFPDVAIACEPAERSRFFDRAFDGVLAIGLVFLLPGDSQRNLVHRMAATLKPGGRLLFSAPRQVCVWDDLLTGRPSSSLGADAYRRIVDGAGLRLVGEHVDEGENHYYEARKNPA
ncbi:class I SAM-dependent methyltransferase [Eilatimonas milleporae]|uniref:class I SAM-dependent methyltransferase n=1 Tax=Eilatimonas milleporae TaxID=911205 RepID=UPI001FE423AE|nr:class I SAM-dependent methyltransferase [Eilatimonas milleporae]